MVEAAFLLVLALLASRVLGVVRQMLFNALFGTGPDANAYYAAARLADTLYSLVSGGALIVAFVPVFLSYEKNRGEAEAWRLASLVLNVIMVVVVGLIVVGEFFAPLFVNTWLVPGYSVSEKVLTTSVARVMLLQPLILGVSTVVTAILNSKRQFLLPAIAIAVYNVGLIAGLLVTMAVPKVGIYGPTYGVLVAASLQVIVQLPALAKQGIRYSFIWNLRHPGLLEVVRLLLPNALALLVAYIGVIIDTNFASNLPDKSSLAAIQNAEMLQALPAALIAQTMGQSLLPHLSLHISAGRFVRMRQTAVKIMGGAILLTLPAAVVLAFLGGPTIRILFQHGAFNQHSSYLTYLALLGYAIALPGYSAGLLIANAYYALKKAFTHLFINIFAVSLRFCLIISFLQILHGQIAILAIPLALAGAATAEAIVMWVILMFFLQRRIKLDKGMQRLLRRRNYQASLEEQPVR